MLALSCSVCSLGFTAGEGVGRWLACSGGLILGGDDGHDAELRSLFVVVKHPE